MYLPSLSGFDGECAYSAFCQLLLHTAVVGLVDGEEDGWQLGEGTLDGHIISRHCLGHFAPSAEGVTLLGGFLE